MIAQITGRAIVFLVISFPLIAFICFSSGTVTYERIAQAATFEGNTESDIEIEEDEELELYSYENIPVTINGYKKPAQEVVDVIVTLSEEVGIDWRITYAICVLESGCGTKMRGDGGLSRGWYHIYVENVCEHNGDAPGCITSEDRYDIHASTKWTVNRLAYNQYLGRYEMIRSHNGLWPDHRNAHYVSRIEDFVALLP